MIALAQPETVIPANMLIYKNITLRSGLTCVQDEWSTARFFNPFGPP